MLEPKMTLDLFDAFLPSFSSRSGSVSTSTMERTDSMPFAPIGISMSTCVMPPGDETEVGRELYDLAGRDRTGVGDRDPRGGDEASDRAAAARSTTATGTGR